MVQNVKKHVQLTARTRFVAKRTEHVHEVALTISKVPRVISVRMGNMGRTASSIVHHTARTRYVLKRTELAYTDVSETLKVLHARNV